MEEQVPTKNEEKISIHQFVEDYIERRSRYMEYETVEAILGEGEAWLEVGHSIENESIDFEYWCTHDECKCPLGDEDKNVFEHIKDAHPSVEGLVVEEPAEDHDEFEDV